MKQNKGISQIVVMVIMLILAIALPITTRLVQQSQENRSKATGGLGYAEICTANDQCPRPYDRPTISTGFCTYDRGVNDTDWNFFGRVLSNGTTAPPVCSYGWGSRANGTDGKRDYGCTSVGGACSVDKNVLWGTSCNIGTVPGVVVYNLCLIGTQIDSGVRCCVPNTVYVECGTTTNDSCVKGNLVQVDDTDIEFKWKCTGYAGKVNVDCSIVKPLVTKWKVTNGSCNTVTGNHTCTSGTTTDYTFASQADCIASAGCEMAPTKWKVTTDSCNTTDGNFACTSGTTTDYTFASQADCVASAGCEIAPTKWKVTNGSCNTVTGNHTCTSGTTTDYTFASQADCEDSTGCDVYVCTTGVTQCLNNTTKQTCADNAWGGNEACAYGCSGGVCNDPTCAVDEKRCSSNILEKCNSTRTGWDTDTNCGELGCNSTTKTCNVCLNNTQKCTPTNKYFTCNSGQWSTTATNCSNGQICTNDSVSSVGVNICRTPEYVAPKLNLFFAVSGVKAVNPCFGPLTFKVNVAKDGQDGITNNNVTAIPVTDEFNLLGDQVFKISNFALTNDYTSGEKIKIFISGRKMLATLYGKDNQTSGFGALNTSQILVSSLGDNVVLDLSAYPVLNGDIGKVGEIGIQDGVVNGADFGHMKNQYGDTCSEGQNLEADLNGDCEVDTFDLQILKNANEAQYAQKTF